jgi:BMFP domain-containing protein YqiC
MLNSINLNQRHEFRDASGAVVGYYIPAAEDSADAHSSAAGQQHWERLYRQVTEERDRLLAEIETLRQERDLYRKSLSAVMREDFTFDKQTLLTRDPSKPTLEQLLKELELARGRNHGGKF